MQAALWTRSAGERRGIGSAALMAFALVSLAALALAGAPADAAAAEGPSLAVLGDKAELAPLVSLVEVELSKSGLRLVERAALDRVLREQELSAGGLADRDALVKVGRLVRADAFLLLSLEEAPAADGSKEGLLRVRLSETARGIRFLDRFAGFAPDKLEAAAEVARDATAALAKLRLGPGQGVAVSVVDIHRVLLGEEHQPQCRTLRGLLAARLGAEPNVVVLEREDLMRLMQEKGLTGGKGEGFWGSAVLVEGRLSRGEGERMELVLQVSPAGKEPSEVGPFAVKAEGLAEAAEQGAAAVMGAVGREGGAAWQPELEAERFYRQGMLLRSHRRDEAAMPLLETAFALQPDNIEYATTVLWAGTLSGRPANMLYTPLEAAELAGRLVYRLRDTMTKGEADDPQVRNLMHVVEVYLTCPASTADERVTELNRAPRKAFADLFWRQATSGEREGELPAAARAGVSRALIAASTPEEAVASIKDYVRRRIMPPELGGEVTSFTERCDNSLGFTLDLSYALGPRTRHIFYWDYRLPNLLVPYLAELASSTDPLVALAGSVACSAEPRQAPGLWKEKWKDPLDRKQYAAKVREIIEKQLQSRTDVSPAAARRLRTLLMHATGSAYSPEETIAIYEEFYRPLIESRDVDSLAAWPLHTGGYPDGPAGSYPRAMAFAREAVLLDQIGDVLAPEVDRLEVEWVSNWARTCSVNLKHAVRDYLDGLRSRASRPAGAGAEEVLAQIAAIEKVLPELAPRQPARVLTVKVLVRKGAWFRPWSREEWNDFSICWAVYQGGVLWVCIADDDTPTTVGLAGLDLKAGNVVALWQMLLQPRGGAGDIKGLAVGSEASYVAFEDEDVPIVEFPGARNRGRGFIQEPRILGEKDGLPVSRLSGMAFWEGKLWIAHRNPEAGLGTYDPVARKWRQVFSSAVPGPTVLEGKGGYEVRELTSLPAGLFFLGPAPASLPAPPMRPGARPRPGGLWRLVPGTNRPEFLSLVPAYYNARVVGTSGSPCICDYDLSITTVPGERRAELLLIGRYPKLSLARGGDLPEQKWPLVPNTFLAGLAEADVAFGPQQFGGRTSGTLPCTGTTCGLPTGRIRPPYCTAGRPSRRRTSSPTSRLTASGCSSSTARRTAWSAWAGASSA